MSFRALSATVTLALALVTPVWSEGAAMRTAMQAVASSDWEAAAAAADLAGDVAADIVEWHRLRAGGANWDDYRAFLARRPDWPGLPLLAERGEGSIPERANPDTVIAFFQDGFPESGTGILRLAAAFEAKGLDGDAHATVVAGWRSLLLNSAEQTALLAQYGDLLEPHHEARLDMLLWRAAPINARAMYPLVSEGWVRLAEARIGLREQVSGVDALIEAVPQDLADDPGLAFERFNWRARKGRNEGAIEIAIERSGSPESLGQPESWASWRATLARWLMRQGEAEAAYSLASRHHLIEGSRYADLEWLSGFIALQQLGDPELALVHFRNFRASVGTPISLGRAGYWEGRALEALGDVVAAQAAYEFGGEHQTSFYGLLAAEKAGLPMDATLATGGPEFPDWQQASFAGSSVLEAALLLREAGDTLLATRFILHLAEDLTPTELGQLSDYVLSLGEHYIAVKLAKQAATQNVILPRAYFPVTDLADTEFAVPPELVLAIARRESEFNPAVISGAGARGLMQVMPGTAQDMARTLDLEYSRARLTTDPAYNAQLGAAYLRVLIEQFGEQWIMVAAGYNAGPSRPRRWAEERGHPGDPEVDAIDWIEMIPFTETRNYVMRVTESLPIYRARLSGEVQSMGLTRELEAR